MDKSICVFCASSTQVPEIYHHDARLLTKELVKNNYTIKYGGGSVGLMGSVAKKTLEMNGKIIGIIPQFMVEMEWANHDVTELVIVPDMHERKKQMISNVDAVVALAGGIGTLDELIEAITLKQLGQFTKPIVIIDTNGFYSNLIKQIDLMIEEGFMREGSKDLWHVAKNMDDAINAIINLKPIDASIIKSAQY